MSPYNRFVFDKLITVSKCTFGRKLMRNQKLLQKHLP